jgi:hypothetical protein
MEPSLIVEERRRINYRGVKGLLRVLVGYISILSISINLGFPDRRK